MDPDSNSAQAERHASGMLAKLKTYSMLGINAMPVEVEVDVSALEVDVVRLCLRHLRL